LLPLTISQIDSATLKGEHHETHTDHLILVILPHT
jgi:hypothetical protein